MRNNYLCKLMKKQYLLCKFIWIVFMLVALCVTSFADNTTVDLSAGNGNGAVTAGGIEVSNASENSFTVTVNGDPAVNGLAIDGTAASDSYNVSLAPTASESTVSTVTFGATTAASSANNKITLTLADPGSGVLNVGTIAAANNSDFSTNSLEIILSGRNSGVKVGNIDFSSGVTAGSNILLTLAADEVATQQVTGNVDFSGITSGTAGITFANDITGVDAIAGSYTGSGGVDTLTFTGSAEIGGAVDMGLGANVVSVTSGKTATFGDALNITGNASGAASVSVIGAGNFTVTGTTTITSDANNSGTLTIASTGTNTLGSVVLAGNSDSTLKATLNLNSDTTIESLSTTQHSGYISVAAGKTVTVTGATTVSTNDAANSNMVFTGAGNTNLGAVTITANSYIAGLILGTTGSNTIGAVTLAGPSDNTGLAQLMIDSTTTVASIAATHSSGTLDIGTGAIVTVTGNTVIEGDATGAANLLIDGYGTVNLGVTTITGTANTGAIAIENQGSNNIASLILAGADQNKALLDLGQSATIGNLSATHLSGTIDVAADKTVTVTGTTTVTGDDTGLSMVLFSGAGSTTLGTVNIIGTAANSGMLQIETTGTNTVGDVTFAGGSTGVFALLQLNQATTVNSLTVESNKHGCINVNNASSTISNNTSVTSTTSTGSDSTLSILGSQNLYFNTVTITATGTDNAIVTSANSATVSAASVTLAGTNAVDDAQLVNTLGTYDIQKLIVNSGYYGTVTHGGTLKIANTIVNGTLTVTNAWALNANETVSVGSSGTLNAAVTLSDASEKLTLDLGSSSNIDSGAKTVGQIITSDTDNSGSAVSNVYAINGVSGVTYNDVFSTAIQAADTSTFGDGKILSTTDKYRIYTLADSGKDVSVSTNNKAVKNAVSSHGGSAAAAKEAEYLIDHQNSFDTQGQTYVSQMTQLSETGFARAAEETIGEEGTTATAQASITSVLNSAGAVSNQMTNFRSGNIAAAMTSSFSSGGATSALSDMADADTLADAYEAGFTSSSDQEVYRKIQVWANGFGGFGEQGTDGNMTGYDFWNIGTMVGFDYAFTKELRVGALLGYSYNNTTNYYNTGDSDDNTIRFGAYTSYNWDDFFIDLSPTMGIHMIDARRNIWTGDVAKGERTGLDFNMSGTIGYTFNLPAEIEITPSYSLNYTLFYDPEYTEIGAGAANVSYDSFTSNSLVQDIGVKFGKLFRVSDKLTFLPEVWGGWEVEYLNTGGTRNTTTAVSIGAQSYSTNMNGMATHRGYWGAGLTALINDNISVYGRYDQKIWDKGYNVGFSTGIKIDF